MKNLAASTAIALAFAAPAFAEAHMSGPFVNSIETAALRASDLIGARLYVSETDIDAAAGQSPDWEDVGEISDIVIGSGGDTDAVLVDIGGFLGLGERTVAVNMDELQFVSDGAAADEYFVVLQSDRATLENAPGFDTDFEMGRTPGIMNTDLGNGVATIPDEQGTGLTTQSAETTDLATQNIPADTAEADVEPIAPGTEPAGTESAANDGLMTAPMMEVDGYETVDYDVLTTEDVTGARVYGVNDEAIGEVGELVMSADGKLQNAVIDVGGFLGLGAKPVAIPFDQLQVMRGENDVRVYVDATEEQLESMPDYDG